MRHHPEHRLQHKIPVWSALMTWLVAWVAEVSCKYKIQSNGRTSYENVTGHKGLQPIAIFGERTMFKFTTNMNNRKNMESDCDHGFFLGASPGTTEYFVGSEDDVYSCATIRRLEEDTAFDPSIIKETKMSYRDYVREEPGRYRLRSGYRPRAFRSLNQQFHSLCREEPSSTLATLHDLDTQLAVRDVNNCSWDRRFAETIQRTTQR